MSLSVVCRAPDKSPTTAFKFVSFISIFTFFVIHNGISSLRISDLHTMYFNHIHSYFSPNSFKIYTLPLPNINFCYNRLNTINAAHKHRGVGPPPWSMVDPPGPFKKTDFPFSGSQKTSIAPQLGVKAWESLICPMLEC